MNLLSIMKTLIKSPAPPVEEDCDAKKSMNGDPMPSRLSRFMVAWWGSIVLHLSLIVIGSTSRFSVPILISDDLLPALFLLVVVYSLSFAVIVVHESFKISLVRCFLVGASLPALTYWMGAIILLVVSSLE